MDSLSFNFVRRPLAERCPSSPLDGVASGRKSNFYKNMKVVDREHTKITSKKQRLKFCGIPPKLASTGSNERGPESITLQFHK